MEVCGRFLGQILRVILPAVFILHLVSAAYATTEVRLPSKDQFFFGISNAPSQVEDQLTDIWMDMAHAGRIPAFDNYPQAEDRIRFWTGPEKEIALAKSLGTEVFRLGVDWQRLFPEEGKLDRAALERYKYILGLIKKNDMKVMLTLFHHTEPRWTFTRGSWKNPKIVDNFRDFWTVVLTELGPSIDYLVTFNEGQIYILMTQIAGIWPRVNKPNSLGIFNFGPFKGQFERSLRNMARAHKEIFDWVHCHQAKYPVGIAHNVSFMYGAKGFAKLSSKISWKKFNYKFTDLLRGSLDYLGLNYYGIEVIKGLGVKFDENYEYSDSGRGIYPDGLYKILKDFNKRYNGIPFIMTENGIADEKDWFRPLYITEHLAAVSKAMSEGVKVLGYIQWTLTDNFEWADGYCPKFGLVAVDRSTNDFTRIPRPSFDFYKKIIQTRIISAQERQSLADEYKTHIGQMRPMCRMEDGQTPLKVPRMIPIKNIDWTFKL